MAVTVEIQDAPSSHQGPPRLGVSRKRSARVRAWTREGVCAAFAGIHTVSPAERDAEGGPVRWQRALQDARPRRTQDEGVDGRPPTSKPKPRVCMGLGGAGRCARAYNCEHEPEGGAASIGAEGRGDFMILYASVLCDILRLQHVHVPLNLTHQQKF